LRADQQDSGKGRLGREWISPLGNLYASTIVRLAPNDPPAPTLAFVAALAVYEAITESAPGVSIQIKWPNDILSGDGAKLCGMLLERRDDAVVVGIGVNIASAPENTGRAVACLNALGAPLMEPQAFLEVLANHFATQLDIWRTYGIGVILQAWEARAHPKGSTVSAHLPDGDRITGQYAGLSEEGAFTLSLADGSIRAIHAADIFLLS
jgi:BirA family transcriptional regulator, biotin operon repressor / biotin---[acetyl-CoA-carboxylase] ligase